MFSVFALVLIISYLKVMSAALIVILSIVSIALFVVEGIICGKITAEIVHKKDGEIDQVLWFWLGFLTSWVAILLTLVVKDSSKRE